MKHPQEGTTDAVTPSPSAKQNPKPTAGEILLGLTQRQWLRLDVGKFIHEHCEFVLYKYRNKWLNRTVDMDELRNTFWVTVVPVMSSTMKNKAHLIPKAERTDFFFGSLWRVMEHRFKGAMQELYNLTSCFDAGKVFQDTAPNVESIMDVASTGSYRYVLSYQDYMEYFQYQIQHHEAYSSGSGERILFAAPQDTLDINEQVTQLTDAEEDRQKVVAMLESIRGNLPERTYLIAYKYIVEKLSNVHIAQHLGISQATVTNALYHLQLSLAQFIPDEHTALVQTELDQLQERYTRRVKSNNNMEFAPSRQSLERSDTLLCHG